MDAAEDGEDASTSRPTKYEARWAGKMEYPETMLLVVNNNMLARMTKWNVEERVIIYLGSISKAAGNVSSSSSDD